MMNDRLSAQADLSSPLPCVRLLLDLAQARQPRKMEAYV